MHSIIKKPRPAQLVCSLLCLAAFAGLEGAAIFFEGFSPVSLIVMILLCAASLFFCLTSFHLPAPVSILLFLCVPAGCFLLMESMTHVVWDTMKQDAVTLNLIFYYLLFAILIFLTGGMRRAAVTESLISLLVGAVNYFVILFRSAPLLPWDLLSIRTAVSVADNYTFTISHIFAMMCGGFLAIFALSARLRPLRLSFRKLSVRRKNPPADRAEGAHRKKLILSNLIFRLACLAVLVIPSYVYVTYLFQPDLADHTDLDDTLFTPKYMYKTDGFFVAFLMNMRFLNVSAPDGYSAEAAETLLSEYASQAEESETAADAADYPNIIVIMNEAFSDPSVLAPFSTNVDYMPNVSALLDGAENTISGHLYSSVLGGNTANSEFEFLTGNTMAFLPSGSIPYQQYINGSISSIVEDLEQFGYSTAAMHPYNASGWNRNHVYDYMGFDRMLFYSDFVNKVKLRKYVSDASDYENVLRILDSSEDPAFIFNVTMQNHSGYGDAYDNFTPEVTAELTNAKSNKYLNNYLSLIKVADEAIGDLLSTLSESDRRTIVVFFGDHQPNDYVVKPIYQENGMDITNQTLEEQQNREIVPFFIWANYDIEEQSNVSVSINYLSTMLFQAAGLPLSGYQEFLSQMRDVIPVLNAVGFIREDGSCHYLSDADETENEWLDRYELLQYYELFDSN